MKQPKNKKEFQKLQKELTGRIHIDRYGKEHKLTGLDVRSEEKGGEVIAVTETEWFHLDELKLK